MIHIQQEQGGQSDVTLMWIGVGPPYRVPNATIMSSSETEGPNRTTTHTHLEPFYIKGSMSMARIWFKVSLSASS